MDRRTPPLSKRRPMQTPLQCHGNRVPPRGMGTSGRAAGFPVPAPAMSEGKRPLRLLGLHGYRQNQRVFHERTGALRKALRGRAELVSVSAPHAVPAPPEQGGAPEPRGWWFSRPREAAFDALEAAAECAGLEAALESVSRALAEQGPFDGLLGFSQGAALAAMVCALQQRGDPRFPPVRFAILVAGFASRAVPHRAYYREPIALPSLHVLGETDRVIPAALGRQLAAHFVQPVVLTHPGGHFVPAATPQKRAYLEFLAQFST